ncbi:anti-sigma factor [soil metagenome]
MTTDIHTLTAPYALDALEPEERERFEAHLESCTDCQSELSGFLATAVRLGDQHETAPPPHLKSSVLAAVSRTPQERPVVTALATRRKLRRTLPRMLTAAAVVLGLVGLGAFAVEHNQRADLQDQQTAMTAVIGAPDAKMMAKDIESGGTLHMVTSQKKDAAVMVTADLPALSSKKVYQLWTIHKGVSTSAGLLTTDTTMKYMDGLSEVNLVAITVEPKGGSESPTTEPIVAVATT